MAERSGGRRGRRPSCGPHERFEPDEEARVSAVPVSTSPGDITLTVMLEVAMWLHQAERSPCWSARNGVTACKRCTLSARR